MDNRKHIIEALLFAHGEAVKIKNIEAVFDAYYEDIYPILCELRDDYDEQKRGMRIIITHDTVKMVSREEYYPYIKLLLSPPEPTTLSQAALETLAIVAYRQPVTRSEIERIRGVQSTSSLDTLIARGLVDSNGRLDLPGRPMGFVTTDEFLQFMQIETIEELPDFGAFSGVDMQENEEEKE
ncbi:MAG: SMC-Scp complex subunit ScpB [Eubacteriaceae bacterium]|nr:SMC-Scp complex subunit ScpB [Eubacteriaceae bacterium]